MRASPTVKLATLAASGSGIGFIPFVPGTWGSLLGVGIELALRWTRSPLLHGGLVVALAALGIWAAGVAERNAARKDPSFVVIDEIAGMLVSLHRIPLNVYGLGAGFVLFRVLDVLKPFPCGRAEKLPSGWGIMLDDLMAGVYANLLLRLLILVLPHGSLS